MVGMNCGGGSVRGNDVKRTEVFAIDYVARRWLPFTHASTDSLEV
jgi:hypothetical protein